MSTRHSAPSPQMSVSSGRAESARPWTPARIAVVVMKSLLVLAHTLLPIYFAYEIVQAPERFGTLTAFVSFLLRWGLPLMCVGILTAEVLLLRRYPDRPAPMAAILLTPPLLVTFQSLFSGIVLQELAFEMATFYLGMFLLTCLVLAGWRFGRQRTVKGWEWVPIGIALVLLFVPGFAALYTFLRILMQIEVLNSGFGLWLFGATLIAAVISEVRLVLNSYPGPTPPKPPSPHHP